MKTKIFIDGSEGTTGLRIMERFKTRDDVTLMKIDPELRKDLAERKKMINESDITFLCLPDAIARESVSLVENEEVTIIDGSSAHRTEKGWTYGFPELCPSQRDTIRKSKRISVPGCHATGFISLAYPLVSKEIMPADYPTTAFSLTGYSGGGKKKIMEYEDPNRTKDHDAPCIYALGQKHKHLPEMKYITGLTKEPIFSPIIADYYSGMVVTIPLFTEYLSKCKTPEALQEFYREYYEGESFIKVMPFGSEADSKNMMIGNECSGWDGLRIFITGNKDRILVNAQFDNLGKGASGAAIQCLNIKLGCDEKKGLCL